MAATKSLIRVAIAEDNAMYRKGIADLLTRTSDKFEIVAEAGNGQELLDVISRMKQHPDICLLDDGMPVLDGFNTLVRLKEAYPLIKVLILTFNDNAAAVDRMLQNGANGYLLKEDDPEDLKRAIEYLVENNFYATPLTDSYRRGLHKQDADALNATEQTFLKLCSGGLTYKQISTHMGIPIGIVEGYRDKFFGKPG